VVGRDHGDVPVAGELPGVDPLGSGRGRQPDEGHIDSSLLDLLEELLARAHPQTDAHVRVLPAVVAQGGRDVDGGDGGDHAHGEPSAHLADGRGDLGGCAFGGVQALTGGGEERRAGRCQPHPAAGALEEPRAELPFQARDLVAEGGLDDHASFGGPREAVRLGDGDDVAHLLELHGSILY
jgi:hypothetical protein